VGAKSTVAVNPQYLMRVAKWLAEQERYGDAHDIYRATISSNSSPAVATKARIALARLLGEKMNSAGEALRVLEDARGTSPDGEWAAAIAQLEEEIKGSLVSSQT
jgi:hypothetical protein